MRQITYKEFMELNERIDNKHRKASALLFIDQITDSLARVYFPFEDLILSDRDMYGTSYGKPDPKLEREFRKKEKAVKDAVADLRKFVNGINLPDK